MSPSRPARSCRAHAVIRWSAASTLAASRRPISAAFPTISPSPHPGILRTLFLALAGLVRGDLDDGVGDRDRRPPGRTAARPGPAPSPPRRQPRPRPAAGWRTPLQRAAGPGRRSRPGSRLRAGQLGFQGQRDGQQVLGAASGLRQHQKPAPPERTPRRLRASAARPRVRSPAAGRRWINSAIANFRAHGCASTRSQARIPADQLIIGGA